MVVGEPHVLRYLCLRLKLHEQSALSCTRDYGLLHILSNVWFNIPTTILYWYCCVLQLLDWLMLMMYRTMQESCAISDCRGLDTLSSTPSKLAHWTWKGARINSRPEATSSGWPSARTLLNTCSQARPLDALSSLLTDQLKFIVLEWMECHLCHFKISVR